MRNCPICNSPYRKSLWRSDFIVADGWKRPDYIEWMKCECGMIYGDNINASQEIYDWYYTEKYGYGVTDAANQARLLDRATQIRDTTEKDALIVDFGGGESGLTNFLKEFGYTNTHIVGCGDELPDNSDVVIAEHVLEHIYDLDSAMDNITESLKPCGTLIVDVPDVTMIALEQNQNMPILDFHQVHINHFRVLDMLRLMNGHGFELTFTAEYHERFCGSREYAFVKDQSIIETKAHDFIADNIAEKYIKLSELEDRQVCVWGFGDIASHCLSQVWPNIKYFVDSDPAYEGATIGGLPIYKQPINDIPIVIIAQSQKEGILDNIKRLGLLNRIIII